MTKYCCKCGRVALRCHEKCYKWFCLFCYQKHLNNYLVKQSNYKVVDYSYIQKELKS